MTFTRFCGIAAFALLAGTSSPVLAQPTADQQAEALLSTARKADRDANPKFAAERYREFLSKYGAHKDAHAARLGLGLALLDLPERDYQKALEALTPAANNGKYVDRARALYYAGICRRGLGLKELQEAVARPNELPQRQQTANGHFTEATKFFTQARETFEQKKPADAEWAARTRCDLAEMQLRLGKPKDASATVEPFVKEAALAKSPLRPLGLYYHGFAAFLQDDIPAAGRSLGLLAPFDQPFGLHARYLLGRVHEKSDEKAEAATAFTAVLTTYDEQKKAAATALTQPDKFKNDPWEKARLEALAKGPAPDYVAGAAFYGACLTYEAGKFGEALPLFQNFSREFPNSPFKDDATLRTGFCQVQAKQYDDAVNTLKPLTGHSRLGDQAFYWIGKAQLGQALAVDPGNSNLRNETFNRAINSLKDASNRAGQLAGQGDADAKARRPEMLLELADVLLTAKQPQQAAQVYEQLLNEKLLPTKGEEILQRIVTAYQLAGDVNTSEARAGAFLKQYPNSPLTPLVLVCSAENAFTKGTQLTKQNNTTEAQKAYAAAAKKYDDVIARFPEFERVNRARYGLAQCYTALEDWEKAATALEAIPAPERSNDLAPANYILADCLIRTAPTRADDALQDNMLREKLAAAVNLLESFLAANPRGPEAPDALLKLALCHKRLGIQLAPGNERNDAFNKARSSLEKLQNEFKQSPLVGNATLERAKVLALQGDKGNAVNTLRQFTHDPLQKSPVAALAHLTLATLLREQNQAQAAADTLNQARQKFEGQLLGDPARAEWVPLLRYHHGVALLEANKKDEARRAFDQAIQAGGNKPIAAEAALKATQCLADDVKKKLAEIEKEKAKPNLTPAQASEIENRLKAIRTELLAVAKSFEQRAEHFKETLPENEARARMLYDAAWCYRTGDGDPTAPYTKLIAEFPDRAIAVEARLELAEVLFERGKLDDAITQLKAAIDQEPVDQPTPPETLERIRLRLGAVLFDKKDYAAALGQFESIASNEKSPHRGHGLYRSAECLLAQDKSEEAIKKLQIFRDNGAFHNITGVSDRAVLRLGYAQLEQKQWEPARQTLQTLIDRYGNNNTWAVDARYGIGLALQNQGRFDDAVGAYAQVTQATQDERAGRSRLQIGECRARQSKWTDAGKEFQTVYYTYDIPELKYTAMLEHARVLGEDKKPADAIKLLERVIKDAPADSEWAKAATERLAKMKK